MLNSQKLIVPLAVLLFTIPAKAGSLVYIVGGNEFPEFGTVDLASGAFTQIGPNLSEFEDGLVSGPNGKLLTLTFSGNLDSINPATGVASLIGATGLADCSNYPISPCGPTSANNLAELGATIYATDLNNDLYTVNPLTGHATLIGATGIPPVPAIPDSNNPDGTFNAFDETLFSAGGNLYATFDAIKINPSPFTVTPVIAPDLYQINPTTGHATLIGPTALTLGATLAVSGAVYSFVNDTSQIVLLNLTNGNTTVTGDFDPAAGLIGGAVVTPEPASMMLSIVGLTALSAYMRRARRVFRLDRRLD